MSLNYYHCYTVLRRGGLRIYGKELGSRIATEEEMTAGDPSWKEGTRDGELVKTIPLTWENVEDYLPCIGASVFHFGKKRCISFFDGNLLPCRPKSDIWERKGKELNLTLEFHNVVAPFSLDKILNHYDGEKAIQFLLERGISALQKD